MSLLIQLREESFEPQREISSFEAGLSDVGKFGATAAFTGTMRDFNEGESVLGMTLEYYPGMTEKQLEEICQYSMDRWKVLHVLLLHRVGRIEVGEAIVLVAVWTAHRGEAFDACRHIMEELKSRAPFWKKEDLEQGERWVERNTSGYSN